MLEVIAVISIVSVLAWFIFGARHGVNLDNYTEAGLKDEAEQEKSEDERSNQ